ncbi:MAG: gluconate 2-dehydrogenase subunit 3 family protein [Janthinobacterium lividum]
MSESLLPILQNPAVLERTSAATRRVLEQRGAPVASGDRFLTAPLFALLQQITATILPQAAAGTQVDIAAGIDQRLSAGTNAGWRFADLPADGEAYRKGLTVFGTMLQQTPMKSFEAMPPAARGGYLRCVANGDVDAMAQFPLSRWLGMLRTDAVKIWMAHPATMQKMEYYGFADGETGQTNGPTDMEGWAGITTNTALPFEHGIISSAGEQKA